MSVLILLTKESHMTNSKLKEWGETTKLYGKENEVREER